jgi:hypothetical protein
MPKITIKAYETVINSDWTGDGARVLIGVVVQGDYPDEYFWDNWADDRIYYYLEPEELANLKVGDVLNDGEDFTIVSIDKDAPRIFEVEYEEEITK